MKRYTFGLFCGLAVGTLFPACNIGQKDADVKSPELRSKPTAEVKPEPAKVNWVTIEGSLKYQIKVASTKPDAQVATDGKAVTVEYTGWLDKGGNEPGDKFDSSKDHGQPFTFTLGAGQVISGWDKGVRDMKVGEQRRLVIPAEFAYGKRGVPGAIPPDATLIFDVELLEIK